MGVSEWVCLNGCRGGMGGLSHPAHHLKTSEVLLEIFVPSSHALHHFYVLSSHVLDQCRILYHKYSKVPQVSVHLVLQLDPAPAPAPPPSSCPFSFGVVGPGSGTGTFSPQAFSSVDLESVRADIKAALTDSRPFWPADNGEGRKGRGGWQPRCYFKWTRAPIQIQHT
jgi:hypothetical protein